MDVVSERRIRRGYTFWFVEWVSRLHQLEGTPGFSTWKWTCLTLLCMKLPIRFIYLLIEGAEMPFRIVPAHFNPCTQPIGVQCCFLTPCVRADPLSKVCNTLWEKYTLFTRFNPTMDSLHSLLYLNGSSESASWLHTDSGCGAVLMTGASAGFNQMFLSK